MIKNKKQAVLTKTRLGELINARIEFENRESEKTSPKYFLGVNSFNSIIEDLEKEIQEYEGLVNGNFTCLQANNLNELPKVLIAARLAQKMSQKDLGQQVDLKEQQIQRYEATDYETASWPRIVEIAAGLNLNLKFEKFFIISPSVDESLNIPYDTSIEQVNNAAQKLKEQKSFIF